MSDPWLPYCFVDGLLNVCCGVCVLVRETAAEVHTAVEESLLSAHYTDQLQNADPGDTEPDDAAATLFVHAVLSDTVSGQTTKSDFSQAGGIATSVV